ncbi:MAG: glutamate--cysteine ligase [Gammaproteobacteria bacterium]|nr:MAG: glutamate--cysteine ligase [Gammaproteobacteria bacterium]
MSIKHLHAVPHLTTALTGPLQKIEGRLLENQVKIEQWFREQWLDTPAPFYASVDLRNAGFKLAPVDTNLFPAGFNNLNPAFEPLCTQALQSAAERICSKACKVVLIPENHTRNIFYLENLATLKKLLTMAGFQARIGSLIPDLTEPKTIDLPSGRSVMLEPIVRKENKVGVNGFEPCFVLLNNDLSGGQPEILESLDNQPVVPPMALGWTSRQKSDHFAHYRRIAADFGRLTNLDPWLIDPLFRKCGKINFHKQEGIDCVVKNANELIEEIQKKYDRYGIDQQPYVVVKADAGTYGMAIITAHSGEELRELNRKQRNKMARTKEGQPVTDVLVQEGIYTFETWGDDQAVAEPVVCMIDHFVVGGFYRVHTGRGVNENLNAPGMQFEPLAFEEPCTIPDPSKAPDANSNRFYAYGVIARLALLAAAREAAALH